MLQAGTIPTSALDERFCVLHSAVTLFCQVLDQKHRFGAEYVFVPASKHVFLNVFCEKEVCLIVLNVDL